MAMTRDFASNIDAVESLRPADHAAGTNGQAVDLRGADSAAAVITVGAVTGSAAIFLEEADADASGDPDTWTAVDSDDIIGTPIAAAEANTAYKLGYIGSKRFLRVVAADDATALNASGMIVLHRLHRLAEGETVAS